MDSGKRAGGSLPPNNDSSEKVAGYDESDLYGNVGSLPLEPNGAQESAEKAQAQEYGVYSPHAYLLVALLAPLDLLIIRSIASKTRSETIERKFSEL